MAILLTLTELKIFLPPDGISRRQRQPVAPTLFPAAKTKGISDSIETDTSSRPSITPAPRFVIDTDREVACQDESSYRDVRADTSLGPHSSITTAIQPRPTPIVVI